MLSLTLHSWLLFPAALSLWEKTSGTWINVATVIIGTGIGLFLQGSLSTTRQRIITQGLGLLTLFLGITLAGSLLKVHIGAIDGVILGLLAIVPGGILGDWWRIERRLQSFGNWLQRTVREGGEFTEGFVTASLLFCVGPMTILGSLTNGFAGNNSLLSIKAVMDGLAAIALTSRYGIGVGFSTIVILCYQGGLSVCASLFNQVLADPTNHPAVQLVTGVGGLMILGLGLNLLEIAHLSIAAFLPALLLAPLLYLIAQQLS